MNATIGRVHLKVADLQRSLAFYRDALGFEVAQRFGKQAASLSADGIDRRPSRVESGRPCPDALGAVHELKKMDKRSIFEPKMGSLREGELLFALPKGAILGQKAVFRHF